ncbi:hypothetical protein JCM11641_007558 [Rhodosporidiobolus odoratus]
MARTKRSKPGGARRAAEKQARLEAEAAAAAASSSTSSSAQLPSNITVEDLLVQSAQHIGSLNYDEAKSYAVQAVNLAHNEMEVKKDHESALMLRDALEILGTVELELNELEPAREHFLSTIQLASALPDPSPAPHLYLAQLSHTPQEALQHFASALTIFREKLKAIEQAKLGGDGGAGNAEEAEDEGEIMRSASRALVGMTELYLTDLCFEPDAEQHCEKYLAQAAELDPTDAEVYQTLASVRLSQQREEDAKAALNQGWELWRKLDSDSPLYPPAPSRLTCAKLFLELSSHVPALEILHRLENEDDEDSEVWYLSGWAWWLLGDARGRRPKEGEEEEETKEECWSEAKLCLENYLKLEERDPASSDPEQMAHVQEILAKLNAAGIVASTGAEGENTEGAVDGEWEDASEDEAMEE